MFGASIFLFRGVLSLKLTYRWWFRNPAKQLIWRYLPFAGCLYLSAIFRVANWLLVSGKNLSNPRDFCLDLLLRWLNKHEKYSSNGGEKWWLTVVESKTKNTNWTNKTWVGCKTSSHQQDWRFLRRKKPSKENSLCIEGWKHYLC